MLAASTLAAERARAQTAASPASAGNAPKSALAEARAHFAEGQAAYRDGQLKLALSHFLRAYELAPSDELEFDLGRVYERLGEPLPAIRHFRNYLAIETLEPDVRREIEARIEKLLALLARQRAALMEPPPSSAALTAEARSFFERGTKLFRQKRYAAALEAFAAARRFARLPELTYNLGLTCERLARTREAIDYYREYLHDAGDAPDAEAVRARIAALTTDRSPAPKAR